MHYESGTSYDLRFMIYDDFFVIGTNCPYERTVRLCFEKFASGGFHLEEKPGRGRGLALDDKVLRRAVEANPNTNTRDRGPWGTS